MTRKDLEARTGYEITAQMVMVVAADGSVWRRVDGEWEPYPVYPEAPAEGVTS